MQRCKYRKMSFVSKAGPEPKQDSLFFFFFLLIGIGYGKVDDVRY